MGPKKRLIAELGCVSRHHENDWRAEMTISGKKVRGPLRHVEADAGVDLDIMRAASSREAVARVAAGLRAVAVTARAAAEAEAESDSEQVVHSEGDAEGAVCDEGVSNDLPDDLVADLTDSEVNAGGVGHEEQSKSPTSWSEWGEVAGAKADQKQAQLDQSTQHRGISRCPGGDEYKFASLGDGTTEYEWFMCSGCKQNHLAPVLPFLCNRCAPVPEDYQPAASSCIWTGGGRWNRKGEWWPQPAASSRSWTGGGRWDRKGEWWPWWYR